jgi:hypothetical protein
MVRYGFNIRIKTGQRVDNILILAACSSDAERRLRQMYTQCEIIERREHEVAGRTDVVGRAGIGRAHSCFHCEAQDRDALIPAGFGLRRRNRRGSRAEVSTHRT